MKSVQIRSYFWFMFSCIWSEYGDLRASLHIQSEYRKVRTRNNSVFGHFSRSDSCSHRRCSVKIGVLKISQNSQENTCTRVSFWIKLQSTWYRCGPVNFAKSLRTLFAEHLWPTVVVNKLDRGGFYHRRPLPLTIFTYC